MFLIRTETHRSYPGASVLTSLPDWMGLARPTMAPVELLPAPNSPKLVLCFNAIAPSFSTQSNAWSAPNSKAPIPGFDNSYGFPISSNALLAYMVYHMNRLANPDVNPKPCANDGIRINDEIHVFVAMYFWPFRIDVDPRVGGEAVFFRLEVSEWEVNAFV